MKNNRMKIVFLSSDINILKEWQTKISTQNYVVCYDLESLNSELKLSKSCIVISDYNSTDQDINRLISSNTLPENTIVLEKSPEIVTGKMLISHNVKAYGNSRMLKMHYEQMIKTVEDGDIWTYPELTATLAQNSKQNNINENSKKLLENRLSQKELEVIYLILDGMSNYAISNKMNITIRTVKAHVSSIFSKLHVNDRVSLILLLK